MAGLRKSVEVVGRPPTAFHRCGNGGSLRGKHLNFSVFCAKIRECEHLAFATCGAIEFLSRSPPKTGAPSDHQNMFRIDFATWSRTLSSHERPLIWTMAMNER